MSREPAKPRERTERGAEAEALAAEWLVEKGFRVLGRNHHCRGGEVDLIVSRGETIVFVEVRSRSRRTFGHPVESVSFAKRRRILRAATHWAQAHRVLNTHYLRFDVIGIVFGEDGAPEFLHIEGAFDGEGSTF